MSFVSVKEGTRCHGEPLRVRLTQPSSQGQPSSAPVGGGIDPRTAKTRSSYGIPLERWHPLMGGREAPYA